MEKSHSLHNIRGFVFLIQIKWKQGLKHEIISDLDKALEVYKENYEQEELLTHRGAFGLLLTECGFQSALKYFNKALEVNPAAHQLQVCLLNLNCLQNGAGSQLKPYCLKYICLTCYQLKQGKPNGGRALIALS